MWPLTTCYAYTYVSHQTLVLLFCDVYVQNLSPCPEYSVDSYVVMFSEVANDFQLEVAPVFNVSVSQPGNMELNISRTVTSADSLLLGRQYNVTIIASNSAGTSSSVRAICECVGSKLIKVTRSNNCIQHIDYNCWLYVRRYVLLCVVSCNCLILFNSVSVVHSYYRFAVYSGADKFVICYYLLYLCQWCHWAWLPCVL